MKRPRHTPAGLRLLLPILAGVVVLMSACASIGRPTGGARDETPPVYVRSNPAQGTTNFKGNRIEIYFDENIKLDDPGSRVVISPAQKQTPRINANGRKMTIELNDTLLENTTYTIDCADAIRDLNEGNILDGFALDFSTGDTIDTLRISGMVLQASNLEPAQGMLVGVYDNLADSAISTLPFLRIAKTNQYGQFTIRNLKAGTYNLFALNDVNRDYKWDRSEDVAFYPVPVTPSVEHIEVTDTLRAADGSDSIVVRPGVRYLPNDLLLTWFNEDYKAQYLKDYSRPDSNRIAITMAAPADSLPELTIVEGPLAGRRIDTMDASRLKHSASLDTLEYWITDPAIFSADSLRVALRYQRTDTLDRLSWTTDTLRFNYKAPKTNAKEDKKHRKKDGEDTDSVPEVPEIKFMSLKVGSGTQEVNMPIVVTVQEPLERYDPAAWHLEIQEDSLWHPLPTPKLIADSTGNLMRYTIDGDWMAGATYRITVDSASVHNVYGLFNKPVSQEIKVRPAEEYSTLIFRMAGLPDSASVMVQLLNSADAPVRQTAVGPDGEARFDYLQSGTYYARAYVDNDNNEKWSTGNLNERLQPEDVYYFPKKINLKKNWDVTNDWNLDETPVDLQKPNAIKKNKPKTKEKSTTADDESDEDSEGLDDMGRPGYDNRNPFDNSHGNSRNRPGGGAGLKQQVGNRR